MSPTSQTPVSDGKADTWFHFLCRNPSIQQYKKLRIGKQLDDSETDNLALWNRFSCFLKVETASELSDEPLNIDSQTQQVNTLVRNQAANSSCMNEALTDHVTLVCFGAFEDIQIRLRSLQDRLNWSEILHDPYILIDILIDELYQLIMTHVKSLRNEFRQIENVRKVTIACASLNIGFSQSLKRHQHQN
jgi:hypothetical protein